ncbi:DUF2254 domain-containing protein [Streptomyces sp. NBC_00083]|uniref:DUF2254 domain-containing protein n=1 Tax=Streptomyces sp. NBC_00083 TaxID=2975647 RepID=UPI00224F3543|nr:DUF2254 domain-containing protein [Streptomyces sp. NBC_00083]MCX5386646.1 DUF2254 domain-containing protein [Streptomyces sp. NBC_00083]
MSKGNGKDNGKGYRRPRALSPLREHLRDTFWFAPTAAMVLVFVLWAAASEADAALVRLLQDHQAFGDIDELIRIVNDTKGVITTVSSAMMTFIGVVFSISLVAVQMASGHFTPRVVRIFVRSRITKLTFAVFLATFTLTLLVLTSFDSEADPRLVTTVPFVQSVLTLIMVALSLFLFIAYVNSTLRLMRVGHVIDRITGEALRVVDKMPRGDLAGHALGPEIAGVAHHGRAGVLRDVHIARLVRAARRQDVVLRVLPRMGDFVVPGTPLLSVHGRDGTAPPSWNALRYTVSVGVERTFHQDLGFGLRQLADIGLRALSAAVNDPTTAVQCLDRMIQVLTALANRPLGAVGHPDGKGTVRLVQDVPGWADLVDLAFAEMRLCAVGSPQVTRRIMAGLDDLLWLVPPERRGPLLRHRGLLVQAVVLAVPEAAERAFALEPDRQGIG